MKNILYFLALLLMVCCHPRKFSRVPEFDPKGKDIITFDADYKLFVREVYKDVSQGFAQLIDKKGSDTTLNENLIEIEYLLYSEHDGKILYITTVPDRNENYYAEHRLPLESQINARDFNTFHFGKAKGKKAEFKSFENGSTYIWEFQCIDSSFVIQRVLEFKNNVYQDERSVENSIHLGALFREINHFEIVYKETDTRQDTTLRTMSDHSIYLENIRNKFCVYLKFDDPIPKRTILNVQQKLQERQQADPERFTTIMFDGKNRVPYDPSLILK